MSNGQIKHAATMEERKRLNMAIDTQIAILWDRIRQTKSDNMKSAWTIAILELKEVQSICNFPMKEVA